MTRRKIRVGLLAFATAGFVAVSPLAATADSTVSGMGVTNAAGSAAAAAPFSVTAAPGSVTPQSVHSFPSSGSTVVGSVGFIDADQVGHFWSAARGDSVTQTFPGPNKVRKIVLNLDVVSNNLNSGAHVSWTASVNGTDVCSFSVVQGQLGAVTHKCTFAAITGGTYQVKLRVTNEVAGGQGSHTYRYAGAGPHLLKLKKRA